MRYLRRPASGSCLISLLAAASMLGCNDSGDPAATNTPTTGTAAAPLPCDDGIKAAFKPDSNTTVALVKAFKAGEPLRLSGTPATPSPPVADVDVCLVKLVVGPGNPGPAGAPSTSSGIGIEVWMPAAFSFAQNSRR